MRPSPAASFGQRVPCLLAGTLTCIMAGTLATTACHRGNGDAAVAGATPVPQVATARHVQVDLALERTSIAARDETLPFTLRLTNPARTTVRVDFTGVPLFPREPREHVPVPALWFTIARDDISSSEGSVFRAFTARDTVLAAGESMEVPVLHDLREVGLRPGTYRMRAGIGAHVSGWVRLVVTQ